jgi:diaminopimelate decarboxylase
VSYISESGGQLCVEQVGLAAVAERFGTPCYVYSKAAILDAFEQYDRAFGERDHLILYAVKANSNLGILKLLADRGSGFDIVSGGELARVLAAGADPDRIVFSGVGKSVRDIEQALAAGIHCFNVESEPELERLSHIAATSGRTARISLRVNPDVDAKTHPYISTGLRQDKFGVPHERALDLYRKARSLPGIEITGIDCHIGSQLTQTAPFAAALKRVLALADALAADGIELHHLDLGGGLGIRYQAEDRPPTIADYVNTLTAGTKDRPYRIMVEPGRSMVGNAGVLLTRVEYVKPTPERRFVIVDAAMNDLVRPSLYDAWHDIRPVARRPGDADSLCQIVGPVCESGDFLGRDRMLAVQPGDLVAVMSAGAYGMSMSSNYNSRPRAAEVMIDGDRAHLVRARETVEDLFSHESFLPSQ